jgi:transposase InsO family protein
MTSASCTESKLRDELSNGEVFNTLKEAQVLIEEWRRHYNRVRPHSSLDSSLGYRPPAPETLPMARSQISSRAGTAAMAH